MRGAVCSCTGLPHAWWFLWRGSMSTLFCADTWVCELVWMLGWLKGRHGEFSCIQLCVLCSPLTCCAEPAVAVVVWLTCCWWC